jgi:hypothetical protein
MPSGHLLVTEVATGARRRIRAKGFTAADRELMRGVTVDLNRSLHVIRWQVPDQVDWVPAAVSVIQNAEATKTLVLPLGAPLSDGSYRLALSIARPWFRTTDPVGPGNTYLDEATIEVEITG